jgi:hypothetical protein
MEEERKTILAKNKMLEGRLLNFIRKNTPVNGAVVHPEQSDRLTHMETEVF